MNRPKSAELRIGHSNVTEFKPHAPIDVPAPPKKFSAVETRLWNEIWSAGRTAYQTTDSHIIERYVSLLARREDLLEMIESEGWLSLGSTGQQIIHPAAKLLEQTEGKLVPLEDRLGLNPESRLRLGISSVESKSKLASFLSDKGGN
tara:strand:- start:846 stop:1286 length:441 start_codon:yes stop_codon:yes gene_type:complete